ncbi:helix-turn-helix domain-containing protein [Actinomadura sp. ATCC 31491]|uniref:Helix-turn-helix domain-containing protein n=1 Tax=Actinomadura luzonensis TaxID=2805427 RepID=A0ABT0G9S0_9ACTN|nr:helix-turn-helix domain-containing protein [Actinomadura luzonensis]MCK2221337.1 helix-turn-helix domain-containing protein [Actinomadura luzonensis]
MKDEEPFVLDDPDRLKALAHPMRRRMLTHLNVHGPATSTTLGELLGAKTGTTSYHLRQLEKYGFIEEIPERSSGRERWWRRAELPRDMRLPTPDQVAPEDRPVLEEFHRVGYEEDRRLFDRFPAAYRADPGWAKGSRGLARMTKEDLDAFYDEYIALLLRYSRRADEAPPGARPVHVRLFTLPADED